jgi:hypothetical protein
MKAWVVYEQGDNTGFCVHAETYNKARVLGMEMTPNAVYPPYIYWCARRIRDLDNLPFTFENMCKFEVFENGNDPEYGDPLVKSDYINWCDCKICKGAK